MAAMWQPGAYILKLFTTVIVSMSQQARVFTTSIHFQPSLICAGKVRSLLLEQKWSPVRGSTLVCSSLACKYQTKVENNGSCKHSGLLGSGNNYRCKNFYSTGFWTHIYNHLFSLNLTNGSISQSVCPCQPFQPSIM